MNTLAKSGMPFLFIIDYAQEVSHIERLDKIDPALCLYQFPEVSNATRAIPPLSQQVEWSCSPPTPDEYKQAFDIVKNHLDCGVSQLVNLTCKMPLATDLTLLELFQHAKTRYKLWLKDQLVCFSPETFVRMESGKIKAYPMKGTIDATLPNAENRLLQDEKEANEHAAVVQLLQNDLSKVATEINIPSYRYIDRLQTNKGPILQTSSEICGMLPNDYHARIGDIIFTLLPAGSITGTPKPETVQLIAKAENYNRGFYTGVMGHYAHGQLDSAVMIRFIEQEGQQLYFKAGGGITAQSRWENEYHEVIQKVYAPIY